MITINASTITNNLLSNKQYSYKITKQGYAFNSDAEESSYNADNIKTMIRHLKYDKKSDGADSSVIEHVRKFVSEYNSLKSNITGLEASDKLTKYMKNFDQLIKDNSDALSDVGITRKSNGHLELSDSTLKAATSEKLEAIFAKDSDFVSKAEGYSKKIYNETRMSMQKTFIIGDYSGTAPTDSDVRNMTATLPSLVSSADALSKNSFDTSNIDNLKSLIDNFIKYYNNFVENYSSCSGKLTSDTSDTAKQLINASKTHEAELKNAGITIDSATGKLSSSNTDGSSSVSDDIDNLKAVFSNSSDYINTVISSSKGLFNSVICGNSSDVSIDFYA